MIFEDKINYVLILKNLIKMAFVTKLTPTLRYLSTSIGRQATIKEFVVIGGGLMGAGIAQVGAQTGHKVTMVDLSQEVLDKSQVELIFKKINHKKHLLLVGGVLMSCKSSSVAKHFPGKFFGG